MKPSDSTLIDTMYAVQQAWRLGMQLDREHVPAQFIDWLRATLPTSNEDYQAEIAGLCERGLIEFDGIDEHGQADYALTPAGLGYVSRRLREQGIHPTKLTALA